jgi:hypothetical protein
MSDTPRTNNAALSGDGTTVPADFAADLEQELNALRLADELEMWTLGEPAAAELRRLHAEVERLRAAARQAVKALEGSNCNCFSGCDVCAEWPGWAETADAIRNALKEPTK